MKTNIKKWYKKMNSKLLHQELYMFEEARISAVSFDVWTSGEENKRVGLRLGDEASCTTSLNIALLLQ